MAGWCPTTTARSRAYPNGMWRKKHIRAEMEKVMGRVKVSTKEARRLAEKFDDYLTLYVDKVIDEFDTTDVAAWKAKLGRYAVAETDKARESGFVC